MLRILLLGLLLTAQALAEAPPFSVQVVDEATERGVPLVELETMDSRIYVTDSAGRVLFREPGQMDIPVWFSLRSHGYEFRTDGFGMTGQLLTTKAGGRAVITAKRRNIAERLCRLTGQGIYRDSVLLGHEAPIVQPLTNAGVVGQDSVQAVIYRGRIFWLWGDTTRLSYPLGNFRTSGAWSDLPGKGGLKPELGVDYHYFTDKDGFAKEMCPLERSPGVVWLFGLAVVRDDAGAERLIAHYARRHGLGKVFEHGIAVFNDEKEIFERAATLPLDEKWRFPRGHVTPFRDGDTDYLYFGDAGSCIRVPARLGAVLDPARYEAWTCLGEHGPRRRSDGALDYAWRRDAAPIESPDEARLLKEGLIKPEECRVLPEDVATHRRITLHAGSVCWNELRQRWILIAVQKGGSSSFLGEVWYAEASAPTGPFARAVKILTHDRYSFYNPTQHPFFDEDGGRLLYFEGTYANTFSGRTERTPSYDYNQILYRLDLADPRLKEAQK